MWLCKLACMYAIVSFCLCLCVILCNLLFIFQDVWFFHKQFVQLGSYDRQVSVMAEAQILMSYWHNDDLLVVSDVYTQSEKEHLYDVKNILIVLKYILLIASSLLLIFGLWFWWKGWFLLSKFLTIFSMTALGFVVFFLVLFGSSWIAWDWLFDMFHRSLFVDNWLFPVDSFLIQSYPWEFFRNAMVVVLVRSGVGLIIVLWLLFLIEKKPRRA